MYEYFDYLEKQRDLTEYLNLVFEVMEKINKLIVFGNLHPA